MMSWRVSLPSSPRPASGNWRHAQPRLQVRLRLPGRNGQSLTRRRGGRSRLLTPARSRKPSLSARRKRGRSPNKWRSQLGGNSMPPTSSLKLRATAPSSATATTTAPARHSGSMNCSNALTRSQPSSPRPNQGLRSSIGGLPKRHAATERSRKSPCRFPSLGGYGS